MSIRLVRTGIVVAVIAMAFNVHAATLSKKEHLGKNMYKDKSFSYNGTQSCETCHHRSAGYADPTNTRDPYVTVVSTGADGISLGGRNAPTSAYAGYSPILYQDEETLEYYGGMFWDGRATGEILGDPLAEQAQGPPLNPVEMNMKNAAAVVNVVKNSTYASLFLEVYGQDAFRNVTTAYNHIGDAIAAYERSIEVQQFNSRYDSGNLTNAEIKGLELFETHCVSCHTISYTPGGAAAVKIFTSYGYANIGIPVNPLVPLEEADYGLYYTIPDDVSTKGKFKIPTLRNIGVTAPYGHNGYFPTLQSIVEFKNDRSVVIDPPEVDNNISPLIGNMGMNSDEINDLVQFLMALTDQ